MSRPVEPRIGDRVWWWEDSGGPESGPATARLNDGTVYEVLPARGEAEAAVDVDRGGGYMRLVLVRHLIHEDDLPDVEIFLTLKERELLLELVERTLLDSGLGKGLRPESLPLLRSILDKLG